MQSRVGNARRSSWVVRVAVWADAAVACSIVTRRNPAWLVAAVQGARRNGWRRRRQRIIECAQRKDRKESDCSNESRRNDTRSQALRRHSVRLFLRRHRVLQRACRGACRCSRRCTLAKKHVGASDEMGVMMVPNDWGRHKVPAEDDAGCGHTWNMRDQLGRHAGGGCSHRRCVGPADRADFLLNKWNTSTTWSVDRASWLSLSILEKCHSKLFPSILPSGRMFRD